MERIGCPIRICLYALAAVHSACGGVADSVVRGCGCHYDLNETNLAIQIRVAKTAEIRDAS